MIGLKTYQQPYMYSFIQRFHETKFPIAVPYHKHHCRCTILFSFCFTNAKQNGGQLRVKRYNMHNFLPWIKCDEIQCINVTGGLFKGLRQCKQPIKNHYVRPYTRNNYKSNERIFIKFSNSEFKKKLPSHRNL